MGDVVSEKNSNSIIMVFLPPLSSDMELLCVSVTVFLYYRVFVMLFPSHT